MNPIDDKYEQQLSVAFLDVRRAQDKLEVTRNIARTKLKKREVCKDMAKNSVKKPMKKGGKKGGKC